jgi:hypothetical protein
MACVPHYPVVILGLVPRIHDFLARTQSRGWPAFADHDGAGLGVVGQTQAPVARIRDQPLRTLLNGPAPPARRQPYLERPFRRQLCYPILA